MFATQSKTNSTAPAEPKANQSGAKKTPQRPNPIWQGLATRHVIQAKLTVSQPNDPYEREADRVADQVMRMPHSIASHEPDRLRQSVPQIQRMSVPQIQRKCNQCEEEETKPQAAVPQIQRKCGPCAEEEIQRRMSEEEEEEEKPVQRKAAGAKSKAVDPDTEHGLSAIRSGGQPLPASVRSFFEPRFGQSFSHVRIHTGEAAHQAATSVNAQAFTLRNNIAFARGAYDASSDSGRRLMAHELTHTVQQSGGGESVQRGGEGIWGGGCRLRAPRVEWALVGAGVWKRLGPGQSTGFTEDCDGMTCGGGFYRVDNRQTGVCSTPRNDDATFAPRRWTPTSAGASATSPTAEGSTGGDTPPNWVYDSAATAPCPNGVRTISVDSIRLHGSPVSPAAQLNIANTVFRPCCVQFVAGASPPQESQATTESWLGGDTDLDLTGVTCATPTADERSLYTGAAAAHTLTSRFRVFYPGSTHGYPAYAFNRSQSCDGGFANHIVVYPAPLQDTLAHEFGHILLNSDAHTGIDNPADTTNVMFGPGRTGSNLDTTQCSTVFSNA